jgi:hypothetical protein
LCDRPWSDLFNDNRSRMINHEWLSWCYWCEAWPWICVSTLQTSSINCFSVEIVLFQRHTFAFLCLRINVKRKESCTPVVLQWKPISRKRLWSHISKMNKK